MSSPNSRMRIKGSALLARKEIVTRRFGADAWSRIAQDMAARYPTFSAPLMASSLIPVNEFLAFHDEIMRRFYSGSSDEYFALGEESAEWALTKGPYRRFLDRKDVASFVDSIPRLSSAYWDDPSTSYRATLDNETVELFVDGLPVWHPYFEYLVVGYIRRALKILCGDPVRTERVTGGSGTAYHYRFRLPAQRP